MEKNVTTPVVKGLIISLVLIVYALIIHFSGQTLNKGLSYFQYVILFAGIIWACISFANQMKHNVTFGNVFSHGFKTTTILTLIMIAYTLLSLFVLFPEMKEILMEQSREAMEKQEATDEQIETAMSVSRKFLVPIVIGGILFMFLFAGAIASLIGAGIAKKNPQDPFVNQVNPV